MHTTAPITDLPILTITQITHAIKHCLENTFSLVMLQGEVSNCKLHTSGHLYFSLKDANAQISAVMFRADAVQLKSPLKDGMQVIIKGELNVFPAGGKYQVIVKELRPVGLGELLLKLEELKMKLHKMGWFSKERKRPLPKFPKTIGIVTSPTGAAIQDILNVLTRRFSGIHLIINPVKVQGEGAAEEIAAAIRQFNEHHLVDVMIVGRGGGSMEDLWAFNELVVAEAIYHSEIPIIAAVGHETDHCIAEYVADVRAPTPSAAAEIVVAEKGQQLQNLAQIRKRLQQTVLQQIRQDKHRLNAFMKHPLFATPYGILGPWIQRLEGKQQTLHSLKPSAKLLHYRQKIAGFERELNGGILKKLQNLKNQFTYTNTLLEQKWKNGQLMRWKKFQQEQKLRQLEMLWEKTLHRKKEGLLHLKESLDVINPKHLLSKGYCILFSEKEKSAITSVKSVSKDQKVEILLHDGELLGTINEIRPK